MDTPTPAQILRARKRAKLSQAKAAALVHRHYRSWQEWEAGKPIDMACWELFQIKAKEMRK